jgi:hypothetical protein
MPTILIPRADVTNQEVTDLLRSRLGPEYHVLPETALNWNPIGRPRSGHPDRVVVGTGSNRLFRAQVRLTHGPSDTRLEVRPGGIGPVPRAANWFKLVRQVADALNTYRPEE